MRSSSSSTSSGEAIRFRLPTCARRFSTAMGSSAKAAPAPSPDSWRSFGQGALFLPASLDPDHGPGASHDVAPSAPGRRRDDQLTAPFPADVDPALAAL